MKLNSWAKHRSDDIEVPDAHIIAELNQKSHLDEQRAWIMPSLRQEDDDEYTEPHEEEYASVIVIDL